MVMAWSGRDPVIGRYRSNRVRRESSGGRTWISPAGRAAPERMARQAAWARSQPLGEEGSQNRSVTAAPRDIEGSILPQNGGLPVAGGNGVRKLDPGAPARPGMAGSGDPACPEPTGQATILRPADGWRQFESGGTPS